MAFNDQRQYPLPNGDQNRRESARHLPRYFRTQENSKFLSSTFDQLLQPGVVDKLNGFLGRKTAPGYRAEDFYLRDVNKAREDYQLEPSAVVKDELDNVVFYGDYNDYINQIKNLNGSVNDHSILNRQEYYSWDPHIDWDKFVNFREYYWLPNGPQSVPVSGDRINIESTYTVTSQDNLDNYAFVFSPDGLTQNPDLTLYRGVTYRFEIDSPGVPLSFRSNRIVAREWTAETAYINGETVLYEGQIYVANSNHRSSDSFENDTSLWNFDTSFNLSNEVSQQSVENGVIELTLFPNSPDFIYYVSDKDINAGGLIRVYDKEQASFIDVEKEILGKKTYTTGSGFDLSNGMKIYFQGTTAQEKYQLGAWYVEGVGSSIRLISEDELNAASDFIEDEFIDFDTEGFDTVPYSKAIGFPRQKDYFTINRSSNDGNLWSKYNRWFHREIIEKSAEINRTESLIDQNARAARPIIEFESDLKLFNYGTAFKNSVDLVDDFTQDVFSNIEGAQGYNIDGIDLTNGMRVLFTKDPDLRVNGKIYSVEFINFRGERQIALRETEDTEPLENQTVLSKQGTTYKGKILFYTGSEWKLAQQKTQVNQAPLFDVFDCDGQSLADPEVYQSSSFRGSKVFSYRIGQGVSDPELGLPLAYRSIQNTGDIVFDFNLTEDVISFCPDDSQPVEEKTGIGYLKVFDDRDKFRYINGWKKAETLSYQSVIRQYEIEVEGTVDFIVDVYEQSAFLDDLSILVFLNNKIQTQEQDFVILANANNEIVVRFNKALTDKDVVQIKTRSSAEKTEKGFYEMPTNLERNPLNADLAELTLGEINDHVRTIVEELDGFEGEFLGTSNLRDKGDVSGFGRRIIKHSSPLNLALYHLLDEEANLVKALRFARQEYGKFKRNFLQTAFDLAFDGPISEHFDRVFKQIVQDKSDTDSFYFSDMVASGSRRTERFTIDSADQQFFALSSPFTLESLSNKSVLVYLNEVQLIYGQDYTFNSEGFVVITAEIQRGDELVIREFESTDASFVPPTPTKLGIYPRFKPTKFVDDTYLEPRTVIQGHDGSIIAAFDDFRDDLILELEKRIYNNIKIQYDQELFDVLDYVPSDSRNTGVTRSQIDSTMISDFIQWTRLIGDDYTENSYFQRDNGFSFNHTGSRNFQGDIQQGFWRRVYINAYDTDRPHTHPWEMLGFSEKPEWWNEQYGPAPYTSNNLLLWEDLEKGIIREPGQNFLVNKKYIRPSLTSHLPVDDKGNLLSPIESNYISYYNTTTLDQSFVYGDWSPVETAWRRSSEYPFALLTSLFINQPAQTMSVCFDRSRQKRGLVNDIIYEAPNRQIRLENLVFPNSIKDSTRVFTAGFVNYIRDYISSDVTAIYDRYQNNLVSIDNQIGAKLAGYTDKEKFRLILDSRTPMNEGNVFVPEENYKIFLNTSTPVKTVFYSGVIIQKLARGYLVRGYNEEQPFFEYTPPVKRNADPQINIGGISATAVDWEERKTLTQDTIVRFRNEFYRVTNNHVTTTSFEEGNFVKLPRLPIQGGRDAIVRQEYQEQTETVPYGTVFSTIQDVVDFILGYGNWLETQGFVFDYYDRDSGLVADWITSTKEYLFWTTQNWSEGSVIALSPGAFNLKVRSENAVVDDIYNTFYGYSLLKVDGNKFQPEFVRLTREQPGIFEISPKNTEDGIFGIRIAFVQKEHAVVIDNRTQFGDIIYDQPAGYRQERIKVVGYRTADWDGSLNIPGFVYDDAKVEDWQPWKDYAIGDLVQYKEFFYAARNKVPGTEVFEADNWYQLDEKPESGLIPNFEYKTNQFADFYDLDTDNFDSEQQKFAQHLIGYQNRDYLANIINDDVSQYKFYQGFIQDKGTSNAFTKLFDALGSANRDNLEFYEEWAIKSGQYGAADGFEEVEYILDEEKFRVSPQPIELTNQQVVSSDLVYRIPSFETYLKPQNYNHSPFPQKHVVETFTKNSGYVNPEDVDFILDTYSDILDLEFDEVDFGNTVWIGNEQNTWNIYTHVRTQFVFDSIIRSEIGYDLSLTTAEINLNIGEIIGIYNLGVLTGFYQISNIENNIVKVLSISEDLYDRDVIDGRITRFVSSRFKNIPSASNQMQAINQGLERLWIDNTADSWKVIDKNTAFIQQETIENTSLEKDSSYGTSISANDNNTVLAVGAPDNGDGKVFVYTRSVASSAYKLVETIEFDKNVADNNPKFGGSVAVSRTGEYLAIGAPEASNVKSVFKGDYEEQTSYSTGEIVEFSDRLWQATVDILGATDSIEFGSFGSTAQILKDLGLDQPNSEYIPILLAGNYPFKNIETDNYPFTNLETDHFLIRAPIDQYRGTGIGDTINLQWNTISYAYQTVDIDTVVQPFNNTIDEIDAEFITGNHIIADKIDSILFVESATNIPDIGQVIETQTAFGTVAYTFSEEATVTIYVKNQNGNFGLQGSLTTSIGEFVGEYDTQGPKEETVNTDEYWGGYWKIDLGFTYFTSAENDDSGRGLIYKNVIPAEAVETDRYYYNILDFDSDESSLFTSFDTRHSEITTLTYEGNPQNTPGIYKSNLFVLRAPKPLTDNLSAGDSIEVFYNTFPQLETNSFLDPANIGLSLDDINRKHEIIELWDGYIDIDFTESIPEGEPNAGLPLEPKVGLTVRDFEYKGTGIVTFYQKFSNTSGRIYVKNVSGRWGLGFLFNDNVDIEFLADGSGDSIYDPRSGSRLFGQVASRSLGYAPDNIGKMLVLSTLDDKNIELQDRDRIVSSEQYLDPNLEDIPSGLIDIPETDLSGVPEYWFYLENTVEGISRLPNLPAETNNDWLPVYRTPAGAIGESSGLIQEGLFSIYQRTGSRQWTRISDFTVPRRGNNNRLGADLKFAEINGLTKLFVKAGGNTDTGNYGKIFIIKNGEENSYTYSWELGKDKQYKGEFKDSQDYFEDDIVFFDGKLYRAITNLTAGDFDISEWSIVNAANSLPIDYLGFIPNDIGLVLDSDNSSVIDQGNLQEFSRDFAVSKNGEVLVTSTFYNETKPNRLVIYRNLNGLYIKSQEIEAPNFVDNFGISVSINRDGRFIAVGAPLDSTEGINQGTAYVYKQVDGEFRLLTNLYSVNTDKNEQFGFRVAFGDDVLAVTSRNGDSDLKTTFDNGNTVFDSGFTKFADYEEDVGIVQLFEVFDEGLLYAQTIDFNDSGVKFYGRNLLINNNHVYVGMPTFENFDNAGLVVDYKKSANQTLWQTRSEIKPSVDVSKIKQIFLYDIKTNVLLQYLDYIDPLQGKIAGVAEQEIKYKLNYDPAVYTNGEDVQIDATNSWGEKQVGEIWWDLSNAKFRYPYLSDVTYSANNWSSIFSEINSIDVYEWVESSILPSIWDNRSGTEQGFAQGITGQTLYGDNGYVEKRRYDKSSQTFSTIYYYWVRDKASVPNIEGRRNSAQDIADLIRDPQGEGYRYISLISPTQFAIYNCESLIKDRDIAINIQYWTIEDQTINVHNQYEIISEGLASSRPGRDVEQKWFDSLVGYDSARRQVPAPELSAKQKYGILNTPRQSWFVNRIEALKQTIERINGVLETSLIVDDKDISRLTEIEQPPSIASNIYDTAVEARQDLDFIGLARARQAKLEALVENGRLTAVYITDSGRGYLRPPIVKVLGTGNQAEISIEINNQGSITSATVVDPGSGYQTNTILSVRRFTVLVENDESLDGRWALYERDIDAQEWIRTKSQGYNVGLYWDYIDWYANEFSALSNINYLIDESYEIQLLDDRIGETVKINNIGAGGWLLLEKIDDQPGVDYTVNYRIVGRQNGTIQFRPTLYDVTSNLSGFDTTIFDSKRFDGLPSVETRIILETIRDEIFTDDLQVEYNKLFFANLRYVYSEQNYVDWAFKTSFIKAQHNVGELREKITFQNDNLPSYEAYVEEVKPYSTSIREYLSNYEKLENTETITTDFDLAPRYEAQTRMITPADTRVVDDQIQIRDRDLSRYPDRHWLDATGFSINKIDVVDPGKGYTSAPVINIEGGGGTGATATASVGRNGKINAINVVSPGEGYLSKPVISINGSIEEGGSPARAVARIGDSLIRNIHSVIKFDRVSGDFEFVNLRTQEQFAGTGARREFDLEWPMDLRTTRVRVFVNGAEALGGRYSYFNEEDKSKGYERYQGKIVFDTAPENGRLIEVIYFKNVDLLNAQDRINNFYEPQQGQFGKSLGQLMQGVDYGGVEVTSFGFSSTSGWDADAWTLQLWDTFDTEFDDEVIYRKQVTLRFSSNIVETYTLNDSTQYKLDGSEILIQDSTHETGYVQSVGETFIVLDCAMNAQFNTLDQIRVLLEDSTEAPVVIEDSSVAVPTHVEEVLILQNPLDADTSYNIYAKEFNGGNIVKDIRLDDPEFNTPAQTNTDAVTETIIGDGSTQEIILSDLNIPTQTVEDNNSLVIILRKTTSDGSAIPDPDSFDTAISGGNLAYETATGLRAEDINIDGDGFVTPTTSKGPEEIVPGQTLDTLDITVYESATDGASNIVSRSYIGDGFTTQFDLGTTPVKQENVFVKIDDVIQQYNSYDINYSIGSLNFVTAPLTNSRISIVSLGNSASKVKDIQTFVGDGETNKFLTSVPYEETLDAFVTVNGRVLPFELIESNADYEINGNLIINFATPPEATAVINILVVTAGLLDLNYSAVETDEFIADGTTTQFTLRNNIFAQQPALANTVVTVNNRVLNPGYSESFVVTESRQYQLNPQQIPAGSVSSSDMEVYLNGNKLVLNQEWSFVSAGSRVESNNILTLEPGLSDPGDELKVYILTSGEYRFGFFDSANDFISQRGEDSTLPVLNLDSAFEPGDKIKVYNFSNHDSQGIERTILEVTEKTPIIPGTDNYLEFKNLQKGIIKLRKPARDSQWVWVSVNGTLLAPNVDYVVTLDRTYVKLVREPEQGDKIDILHFANDLLVDSFGWRQFKDMLNRTHYKRLSKNYFLAEDLKFDDTVIEVDDATDLPDPNLARRTPGVIFLDKERIEYFFKDGNTLKQLRRGTLGTGIKNVYSAGTAFMEQGSSNNLPYKDSTEITKETAGGYNQGVSEFGNSPGMSIDSIEYDFNNNTAFPLGGQIATVIGQGFREDVVVKVGEINCETTYISETELTFITPALPVGAYDLIVINPRTEVPLPTPQTSIVAEQLIKYVQILLPYAPLPETENVTNPAEKGEWYTQPFNDQGIPDDYWQALDIDVFVAGKRLRKNSVEVYNFAAQDSPEGDVKVQAEFAVNKGVGAYVRLTEPPPKGSVVEVFRKTGTVWVEQGKSLAQSETDVARFLQAGSTDLLR